MLARKIINQLLSFFLIIVTLLILNYPILLNADFFLHYDELAQGVSVVNLYRGSPLLFYYPSISGFSYHGVLHAIFALPFFKLIGISTLSYKLPAILFYALHTWCTCWIAGKINPKAPFLVGLLMVFCSRGLSFITTHTWTNGLLLFLGSLSMVIFVECYLSKKNIPVKIFSLSTILGLSIYAYTYSIVYVATILLIFILTSSWWVEVRSRPKMSGISLWWKSLESKKLRFVRVLDLVIISFLFATGFAYIWGGFAVDMFGVSFFQIKNFHKPVGQVLTLIIIRLLIHRQDISGLIQKTKAWAQVIDRRTRSLIALSFLGFIIGLAPRIIGIVNGEITRGGQGFDLNLSLFRLFDHLKHLMFMRLPDLLGLYTPFKEIFSDPNTDSYLKIVFLDSENDPLFPLIGVLAFAMLGLFLVAGYSFFKLNSTYWKKVFKLESCKFDPILVFIVLPTMVTLANMLTENGTLTIRYIYPLYSVVVIWVAIYLLRVKEKSLLVFLALVFIWVGFYSLSNYRFYRNSGIVRGLTPVEKKLDLREVKRMLNSEGIESAFSNPHTTLKARLIDQKPVFIADADPWFYLNILPKSDLTKLKSFAIVIKNENKDQTFVIYEDKHWGKKRAKKTGDVSTAHLKKSNFYETFLREKQIKYQKNIVGGFIVFFDFQGDNSDIEELKSIIKSGLYYRQS